MDLKPEKSLRSLLLPKNLFFAALLTATLALPGIARSGDDPHSNPHNTPNGGSMMGPATVPDLSLPLDCKSLDDELARIRKFAANPKATKAQLAANAKRAEKLEAKRKKLQCPTFY